MTQVQPGKKQLLKHPLPLTSPLGGGTVRYLPSRTPSSLRTDPKSLRSRPGLVWYPTTHRRPFSVFRRRGVKGPIFYSYSGGRHGEREVCLDSLCSTDAVFWCLRGGDLRTPLGWWVRKFPSLTPRPVDRRLRLDDTSRHLLPWHAPREGRRRSESSVGGVRPGGQG